LEDNEDGRAVEAFQNGEKEAFDRLVSKYQGRVYRLCLRFTGNHYDADDQAQEAFIRAYRGLRRYRGQARFSTWLFRIVVNTCLSWAAARRPSEELVEDLSDPAPGPLERLGREQESLVVRDAISRLPAKQRMTLVLRVYHGFTHREIAELLDGPVGTVKANFFFALQNLRKSLTSGAGREPW